MFAVYLIWNVETKEYVTVPSGKGCWMSKGAAKNAAYNIEDYPRMDAISKWAPKVDFKDQTKYQCHEVVISDDTVRVV